MPILDKRNELEINAEEAEEKAAICLACAKAFAETQMTQLAEAEKYLATARSIRRELKRMPKREGRTTAS